jgi:hypothetical protein
MAGSSKNYGLIGKILHRMRSSIPGISLGGMFVDDWFLSSNDAIRSGETLLYATAKMGFSCNLKKTQRRNGGNKKRPQETRGGP